MYLRNAICREAYDSGRNFPEARAMSIRGNHVRSYVVGSQRFSRNPALDQRETVVIIDDSVEVILNTSWLAAHNRRQEFKRMTDTIAGHAMRVRANPPSKLM